MTDVFASNIQEQLVSQIDKIENLYSYLYSHRDSASIFDNSRENLDSLIKLYDRRKMIPFIGAGTSIPLGIADWESLMKELIKKANETGLIKDLPSDPEQWPQAAQDIYDYWHNIGRTEQYFRTIFSNIQPSINTTSLTLIKMVLAFDILVTTNYDNSIKNAFEFLSFFSNLVKADLIPQSCDECVLPDFNLNMTSNKIVCYLHGNVSSEAYIFKKNDYDNYYPSVSEKSNTSDRLEDFLKSLYTYNNMVFVGFSFQDVYLRKYFFHIAKRVKAENKIAIEHYGQSKKIYEKKISHFLIISEDSFRQYVDNFIDRFEESDIINRENHVNAKQAYGKDFFNQFEDINVYPIIYKENKYLFLEKLFEQLCNKGKI